MLTTYAIFIRKPRTTHPRWVKVAHRRARSRPDALRAYGLYPGPRQNCILDPQGNLFLAWKSGAEDFDYLATNGVVVRASNN